MKVVATINFKGGVGKTTITWLMAKYIAEKIGKKVLVFDGDAQMSLTLALSVDESSGRLFEKFGKWYAQHQNANKTILDALEAYRKWAEGEEYYFNFPINRRFFYEISHNLFFVPSVTDLYWLELEYQKYKPEIVKGFVKALLGKITNVHNSPIRPDIVFFDCPPNFTALSYSILSNCSTILIPVNPDVFASTGVQIMIEGLKKRVQPWPDPKLAVFLNKARLWRGQFTRETATFFSAVKDAVKGQISGGEPVYVCKAFIPERADIRKAINFGGFPQDYLPFFEALYTELENRDLI